MGWFETPEYRDRVSDSGPMRSFPGQVTARKAVSSQFARITFAKFTLASERIPLRRDFVLGVLSKAVLSLELADLPIEIVCSPRQRIHRNFTRL